MLVVNVFGLFVMGVIVKWFFVFGDFFESFKLFLIIGFLGGFIIFLVFFFDVVNLV